MILKYTGYNLIRNTVENMNKTHRMARRGILAFEWILITALLVIGIIAGLGVLRNTLAIEYVDTVNAVNAIDVQFVDSRIRDTDMAED